MQSKPPMPIVSPDVLAAAEAKANAHLLDLARAPSPTPTEIDDPEPELIIAQLHSLNIKVRDFAYPPPSHPRARAQPAFETFDPYKGISEFEYRLSQAPRTYPIDGRTLRRLLDLGWVSMPEAKARLHQMDWEAMKDYDARDSSYPWRACRWSEVPDAKGRAEMLRERLAAWIYQDKIWRMCEAQEAYDERERKLIEEAQERLRVMEAEREGGMGMVVGAFDEEGEEGEGEGDGDGDGDAQQKPDAAQTAGTKRALEYTPSTPNCAAHSESLDGPKRARLSGAPSSSEPLAPSAPSSSSSPSPPSSSSSSAQPIPTPTPTPTPFQPTPPPRQYPAPLSTYNPALYPEAARVIEAEARPPPARVDTPPLGEDDDDEERQRPGQPLQRRRNKGLKRSLSRTQTFRQV